VRTTGSFRVELKQYIRLAQYNNTHKYTHTQSTMLYYYNVKSVWFDFKRVDEGCADKSRRYLYNACILVGRRRRSKIIIKKFVRNDNIDTISTSRYSYIIF
jgi:hypothetical protein